MNPQEFDALRKTVATRSGPIGYAEAGEGPVSLFVHGVGMNGYLWRNVMGALRDERRCIALDLPLHGHSPARPGQDLSLPGLAGAVEDFCAALNLSQVDLVANDTGGAVCQILAARHPERLRTMVLTNCDAHDNVPPDDFKPTVELAAKGELALTAPQLMQDPDLARTIVYASTYEHPERLSDEEVRAFLEPVIGSLATAREFERLLTSMRADDLLAVESELHVLNVPTLIVWGTGDTFFDVSWAYWLRDNIAGASEVVEVADAKLFFPDERADELVPHLRRHWAEHRQAA